MKTIKKYPAICKSCEGSGYVNEVSHSSAATKKCPVCNGAGVMEVTEERVDDYKSTNPIKFIYSSRDLKAVINKTKEIQ